MNASPPPNPQHELVAPFIEQIRSGQSFLVNKNEAGTLRAPLNPVTGNAYSGINRLLLTIPGETDPRWMTKNQAENQGYAPKDNAAPRKLVFWESFKKVPLKGEDGQAIRGEDGRVKMKTVRLERPEMRFYEVYHARDLAKPDGQEMPPYEDSPPMGDVGARINAFLEKSGAEIDPNGPGTAGFYSAFSDKLIMPAPEVRPALESESQALTVHALCGRISYKQVLASDDQRWPHFATQYPEQHLLVTVASMYASQDLGLPSRPFGNGPANKDMWKVWASAIEEDPNVLFRACAGAEKVKDQLLSLDREVGQERIDRPPVKLSVPFDEQEDVKELGAYFLPEEKLWVSSPDNRKLMELTACWPYDPENHKQRPEPSSNRTYLDVAFEEKDRVKELGGKYDFHKKKWYVEPDKDLAPFIEWLSEKDRQTLPVLSPEEEFAEVLKKAGLVLNGPPVMDGTPHKVPAAGQKKGKNSPQGTYCFMPEISRPSFYMNHHSGVSDSWTYSGQMLSESKRAELQTELGDTKQRILEERGPVEKKAPEQVSGKQAEVAPDAAKAGEPEKNSGLGR